MKKVYSLVITGFGINCEEEMAAAYKLVGAQTQIVHLNEIFNEQCSIHDFSILNFPGGFSYGDDLGSAKVLANKLKYKRMKSGKLFFDELQQFIDHGKFILGICNGFQLLVKMGLLPNINGKLEQEVTLTYNDSGKFEDRWCNCVVSEKCNTPFLSGIGRIDLPVRHGEGKLLIRDAKIKEQIVKSFLNCLSYCDKNGNVTLQYPFNPNGSELNCAGLTDKTGRILGLMPHPEAFISIYNHPNWGQKKRNKPNLSEEGEGLKIFRNIIDYITMSLS